MKRPHQTSGVADDAELNFDDIAESFKVKTDSEIIRALLVGLENPFWFDSRDRSRSCPQVFNLCSIQPLVKNARYFFDLGSKIAGALAV